MFLSQLTSSQISSNVRFQFSYLIFESIWIQGIRTERRTKWKPICYTYVARMMQYIEKLRNCDDELSTSEFSTLFIYTKFSRTMILYWRASTKNWTWSKANQFHDILKWSSNPIYPYKRIVPWHILRTVYNNHVQIFWLEINSPNLVKEWLTLNFQSIDWNFSSKTLLNLIEPTCCRLTLIDWFGMFLANYC